jgi:putative endopeptidase
MPAMQFEAISKLNTVTKITFETGGSTNEVGGAINIFFIKNIDIMDIDSLETNNGNNNGNNFDLYEAINGKWEREFTLPPHESEWGTFKQISHDVEERLKDMLLNDESSDQPYLQKLYTIILNLKSDTDRAEARTLIDILKLLDPENYRDNRKGLGTLIGMLDTFLVNPIFSTHTDQDPKNTDNVRLTLIYPGLTLPDKIYYEDESYSDYVEAFRTHAENVFSIYSDLTDNEVSFLSTGDLGRDVVEIETLIAKSVRSAEEKRNMDSFYARLPYTSFVENVSLCDVQESFDCKTAREFWNAYFHSTYVDMTPIFQTYYPEVKSKIPEEIVVYDTPYFHKLTKILMTQPVEKICRYLAYHLITGLAMITIRSFDDTYRDFVAIKLNGQEKATPRDDRTLRMMDDMLGEFIGKEYVKKYFNPRSKQIVTGMTDRIRKQMRLSIESNTWMSSKTKEAALLKLDSISVKIGYPDEYDDRQYMVDGIENRLSDYPGKTITSIILYIRVCYFAHDVVSKIDTPKDPTKWAMNPQDVNAYYSPQMNEIAFPAGILNAPIFDPDQDVAKNYGGIGTVIAHEITHGFDDQGRKYDHKGNINNWWTMDDLSSFKNIVGRLVDQYSKYRVDVDTDNGQTAINVNGLLTLGENIADLGGVTLSLRAYEDEVRDSGRAATLEDKKHFFDSYALLWRKKVSPAKTMARLLSDPHSPGRYRVWVIRNIDSFYDAYGIQPGEVMHLESHDRIKIY